MNTKTKGKKDQKPKQVDTVYNTIHRWQKAKESKTQEVVQSK